MNSIWSLFTIGFTTLSNLTPKFSCCNCRRRKVHIQELFFISMGGVHFFTLRDAMNLERHSV